MRRRTPYGWRLILLVPTASALTLAGCSTGSSVSQTSPSSVKRSVSVHSVPASSHAPASSPVPTRSPFPSPARSPLAGRIVVIDPGHNGGNAAASAIINRQVNAGGFLKECDTTGTQTDDGYPEYAFTLDVADRAAALLRQQGARVILTRTNSNGVGPCVNDRAAIGNNAHANAAISIHADGGPATGFGFHVIEPSLSPDGGNAAILAPSAQLALAVRSAFATATGEPFANYIAKQGLIARNDLGGLNLSRVPKVFIECANMRNAEDALHVKDPAWRQRAANGVATGIENYLEQ